MKVKIVWSKGSTVCTIAFHTVQWTEGWFWSTHIHAPLEHSPVKAEHFVTKISLRPHPRPSLTTNSIISVADILFKVLFSPELNISDIAPGKYYGYRSSWKHVSTISMSGTILSGDGWFGKWPSKGLPCCYRLLFLKKLFIHIHKFLFSCTHCLKWFYDAILTGSPHLLGNYFDVPHDMHIARPPVHTLGAGIGLSTSRSHFGERSFHIREKFCLWFDPSDQVTGAELKSPPFSAAWPGH